MATVKEFRDLKVPFVDGDKIAIAGSSYELATIGIATFEINDGYYDKWEVESFTLRKNTGKQPVGDNVMVQLSRLNFSWSESVLASEVDWEGTGSKFWRPSLKQTPLQVESPKKTVYTQTMYDAGEKVRLGMLFATEVGHYEAEMVNLKSICFTDEDGFLVTIPHGKAKPIQTDSERRIEKALSICSILDEEIIHHVLTAIIKLEDAGLLK